MRKRSLLALALCLALLTACSPKEPDPTPTPAPTASPTAEATPTPTPEPTPEPTPTEDEAVRVAMLKGPTGLGAAMMMNDSANAAQYDWSPEAQQAKERGVSFDFTVLGDPQEAVAGLSNGTIDIAALPTNLASTLYHKLDGGVQLACINTLGSLYVLENGETVNSLKDLEGKTVYAYGQGANPEYVLNYLLELEGADSAKVDLQWKGSTDEVAALMASGEAQVCMLPVPAATTVLMQNDTVRTAVDLGEVWESAGAEGELTMGCVVVRTEFAQSCPEAVDAFLALYADSIAWMADPANLETAAQLAETYGIVPKAAVAKRAIPDASLCYLDGGDMVEAIQGYYQVLYAADPKSIGGSIPDGAFYYGFES